MKRFLFLILAVLLFAGQGWGATYCIKATGTATKDNAVVADAAACTAVADTAAMSLATFNASTFSAGDTIYFTATGGNFTATVTLPSGGSSGSVITYQGLADGTDGARPIITAAANLIRTNSKSYITVSGFSLIHTGTNNGDIGVDFTGNNTEVTLSHLNIDMAGYGYGIAAGGTCTKPTLSNIITTGTGAGRFAIYFYGTGNTNGTLTNITSNDTTGNSVRLQNFTTLSVASFNLGGTNAFGLLVENSSSVNISTGTIGSAGKLTVGGASHDVTIEGVTISGGYGFWAEGTSYNIIYNDCLSEDGLDEGYTIRTGAYNVTYNRCTANNNTGTGFKVLDNASGINYYDCQSNNNTNNGFDTDAGTTTLSPDGVNYYRCSASYNGTVNVVSDGLGFAPHSASTNINAYYFVSHHNYTGGIAAVGTSTGGYYNGVLYSNGYALGDTFRGTTVTTASNRGNLYFANPNTGFVVKNTISASGKPREILHTGTVTAGVMDYNLYYPLDAAKFVSYDATNNVAWSTYKETQESHSQNADPRFRSTTDFRLLPSSPCINKGTSVGLTTDFLGHSLRGTPDIGAYEYWGTNGGGGFSNMNFNLGW